MKLPALAVQNGEDDEVLSRATTLTQNTVATGSVAGAIPPAVMMNLTVATSLLVIHRATRSLGLLILAIEVTMGGDDDGCNEWTAMTN
jgi:hypothetical protein